MVTCRERVSETTEAISASDRNCNLLVVDDDDNFRETLSDAMSLKDVQVQGVGSGAAALECIGDHRPDLILMDVQLPDAHGFELCRALKKDRRYSTVPIVLLSAKYTEPADRVEGLMTGADAFFSKPIGLETLWEEVRYLLDSGDSALLSYFRTHLAYPPAGGTFSCRTRSS